ncbi:MAG: hypothetical protein FWF11_02925, partial [Coriobacteriia bacterium]|nr:hypothetical protein [Coriobacteriia bacterium]
MLSKKKAVIAFAVLLLGIGIFASIALAIDPSLDGLTIRTGTGPTSDASSGSTLPPASLTSPPLAPGEVRTSKSIVYNTEAGEPDGTITVTLSAWARPYLVDGVTTNPLTAMAGGVFVEIVDDIGEFIVEGPLPAGLSQSGTQLTWNITDQTSILGPAPLTLSYTLTVASPAN